MKISELINISKTMTDDSVSLQKLNCFIEKLGCKNSDLTPKQIYALVVKLDLFASDVDESLSDLYPPSQLIGELQKHIIKEITFELIKKELDEKSYAFKNAVAMMYKVQREGFLTEKNFVCLIGKGPNAFLALDTFFLLLKYKFPLNDTLRKNIIDVYRELPRVDIIIIRGILLELAEGGNLTKELLLVVLFNPYKKWHRSQGYALSELCHLNLLHPCQNIVLRDAEQAGIIASEISVLSKLPTLWSSIEKELAENPESATEILEMHYKEYEKSIKNELRIKYPRKEDYVLDIYCFNHMINLSEKKRPIGVKKSKKTPMAAIKQLGIFHLPTEIKEEAKKEETCLIM